MRKRTLGVVLLAGLATSGAGAFTGSSSFSGTPDRAAAGVTLSNVKYDTSTTDASQLASVAFTVTQDVTVGYTSTMTLRNASEGVLSTTACGAAVAIDATNLGLGYSITCDNVDTSYRR